MEPTHEEILRVLRALAPSVEDVVEEWGGFLILVVFYCAAQAVGAARSPRASPRGATRVRLGYLDRFFHVATIPMLLWSFWASDWLDWLYSGSGRPSPASYLVLIAGGAISATLTLGITLSLSATAAIVPRSRAAAGARRDARHDRILFFLAALPALANWYFAATIHVVLVATHSPK